MPTCSIETQQHFAFDTITVDAGDTVEADQANDTLDLTSSDNTVLITGTAASDSIDFTLGSGLAKGEFQMTFFADSAATAFS